MSNPKEEKESSVSEAEIQEGHDIEFEDTIDIDKIQQTLQKHLEEDEKAELNPQEDSEKVSVFEDEEKNLPEKEQLIEEQEKISADEISLRLEKELPEILQNASQEIDPQSKKYVIYIDPENIPFMDNLSISERKEVINQILREREDSVKKQKAVENRKTFMRHMLVASITFILGFPVLFFVVNKSMEAVIANYKQAEKNFSTLYKEKGKIQPFSQNAAEKFKY